ncbi:ATPase [Caulobacter phage CcrBL9]|uniref:3'-phosphatase, 5'-polynucleotide kinase n=1 Tax=Caulobacter phage CcrBL9 TaxID=2283270 RepID=A0A385EEL9_9CAUD|nr:ATPase [Caulobacter phage CcrBL9]AXQ69208.1 3'-phosphatase, 5'-polynucleotide kinase [Caulobacter phage CcrBL9]
MGYYIFDFDGTIAWIDHRRHLVAMKKWDEFFQACDRDEPVHAVLNVMKDLIRAGHRVEIWSGRSDIVFEKSAVWLEAEGIDRIHLKRMRVEGDNTPDEKLKLSWLLEERALGNEPDAIFDDRQKVVDMWRANGVACFQVAPGDFDEPPMVRPYGVYVDGGVPLLTVIIGISGAGKSTFASRHFDPATIVASDAFRRLLTGSPHIQDRNAAVFAAVHKVVGARMEGGLPTVVDATNIRRADRVALAKLAPKGVKVAYVLIDRPIEDVRKTAGAVRTEVIKRDGSGEMDMLTKHASVLKSNMKDIKKGDDQENVEVFLTGEDYLKAIEARGAAYAASEALVAAQMVMGVSQGA